MLNKLIKPSVGYYDLCADDHRGWDVGGGYEHLQLDQINKFKPRQKDVGDVEVAF